MTGSTSLDELVWSVLAQSAKDDSSGGWITLNQLLSLVNVADQRDSDQHIGLSSIKLVDPVENMICQLLAEGHIETKENKPIYDTEFRITRNIPTNPMRAEPALRSSTPSEDYVDVVTDSAAWTGIPTDFVLNEQKRHQLVALLEIADSNLDTIGATNHEKAMARAYIVAAKTLADAPDPPADLIWELLSRANQLSGIASLFVSIMAFFATVTN